MMSGDQIRSTEAHARMGQGEVRSTQMKQSEVNRVNEGGDEGGEMETRNDRPTLKTYDILL